MNRCVTCRTTLRFYGISQTKTEGWVRWSVCDGCGLYHKADETKYIGLQRTEPSKIIFRGT